MVQAESCRDQVPHEDIGHGLGALDPLRLIALHEHHAGSRQRIEVAGQAVLVGAGIEKGDRISGLDIRDQRVRNDAVWLAGEPDDVGHQRAGVVGLGGDDRGPAVMFPDDIRKEHVRGVRLDPPVVRRRLLHLDVSNGCQMNAGIAIDAAAGLDLEANTTGIEVPRPQRITQTGRDNFGIDRKIRGRLGPVLQPRHPAAEGVAWYWVAAPKVELGRCPPVPRLP